MFIIIMWVTVCSYPGGRITRSKITGTRGSREGREPDCHSTLRNCSGIVQWCNSASRNLHFPEVFRSRRRASSSSRRRCLALRRHLRSFTSIPSGTMILIRCSSVSPRRWSSLRTNCSRKWPRSTPTISSILSVIIISRRRSRVSFTLLDLVLVYLILGSHSDLLQNIRRKGKDRTRSGDRDGRWFIIFAWSYSCFGDDKRWSIHRSEFWHLGCRPELHAPSSSHVIYLPRFRSVRVEGALFCSESSQNAWSQILRECSPDSTVTYLDPRRRFAFSMSWSWTGSKRFRILMAGKNCGKKFWSRIWPQKKLRD